MQWVTDPMCPPGYVYVMWPRQYGKTTWGAINLMILGWRWI